jgi:hypothetical protein
VDPTQVVGPVYPIPPHCPYLICVPPPVLVDVVEVFDEVVDFVEVFNVVVGVAELLDGVELSLAEEEEEEEPPPVPPPTRIPVYVLLMAPHLMLEYVTEAFGESASTTIGLPEVAEQVPRLTPGALGDLVGGYGASSQSISMAWSSQMDITRTIPVLKALLIVSRPPFTANSFVSPKAVFCAVQKLSVIEFPVTPAIVDTELGMIFPF